MKPGNFVASHVLISELATARLVLRAVRRAAPTAYTRNFADYEVVCYLAATVPWLYPDIGFADFITNRIAPIQGKSCWCSLKEKAGAVWLRNEPTKFVGPARTAREVWALTKTAWNAQSKP